MVPKSDGMHDGSHECLVVDKVANLDWLERLMVFVVGFDEVPGMASQGKEAMHCRSAIYRAITRAIMYVVIINELLPGGMLEFLGFMELEKGVKLEASKERARIDHTAVRELMQNAQVVEKAQKAKKARPGKQDLPKIESIKSGHMKFAKAENAMKKAAKPEEVKLKARRSNNVWDTSANSAQVLILSSIFFCYQCAIPGLCIAQTTATNLHFWHSC
jgi:hypothetical protein